MSNSNLRGASLMRIISVATQQNLQFETKRPNTSKLTLSIEVLPSTRVLILKHLSVANMHVNPMLLRVFFLFSALRHKVLHAMRQPQSKRVHFSSLIKLSIQKRVPVSKSFNLQLKAVFLFSANVRNECQILIYVVPV